MKLDIIARNYATALFNVAVQSNSQESLMNSFTVFSNSLKNYPELRSFIQSKRISNKNKASVIVNSFQKDCDPIFYEFIRLLNLDFNLKIFYSVFKAFEIVYFDKMNIVRVTAHVSDSLDFEEEKKIKSILEKRLNKSLDFKMMIDPDLIGGIKLRIGNKFLDSSIKSHLMGLRASLMES